jgi:CMP-N,N'-diacetyllegionaminic acid synthase|tara:strand:- start:1100 stop:1774 length:675 start_codon:yes stop_codon:yes gene_type:complete
MINNKSVMAITLARGGSKRVPRKNVLDINGKPLVQYTIDEVRKSKYVDNYIVSTDDSDIKELCRDLGQTYYNRRPVSDTQKSSDGILEVLKGMDKPHYVIEVMCTNPLKKVDDIDGVIEKIEESQADTVCSVVRVWDYHPSRIKFMNDDGTMKDVHPEIPETRRQDLNPPAYIRNGSIYAMTWNHLHVKETRYDKNTVAYIMPEERTINIDEPIDLELARILTR